MTFYKYQGAGNDFLIFDDRENDVRLTPEEVSRLCDRRYGIGADGVMLLQKGEGDYDFKMVYYNSDGSGGMMCGNGGRCLVAFAYFLGFRSFNFMAADGPHHADVIHVGEHGELIVRLGMCEVKGIKRYQNPEVNGAFLYTGTRHFVCEVTGLDRYDVSGEGCRLRHRQEFAPEGANVNFIEYASPVLCVRTFEKGVEAETYACGTGIVASVIAWWHNAHPVVSGPQQVVKQKVKALRDNLEVEFVPTTDGAKDVFLIGPATYVAKIEID